MVGDGCLVDIFRMKQTIYHYGWIWLVWLVMAGGMIVRIHNGDYFPIYQNDDSPFYVWLGNSVYQDFMHPSTLTIFADENPSLFWRSQYHDLIPADRFGFRMTEMFFDSPFLATLLIALPARFYGYTGFSQIPQMLVRVPAFMAALATLGLTYYLAKTLFNKRIALLALIMLAFWPLAVFSQRQGYLENFITPVWLLSLAVLWLMRKQVAWPRFILLSACGLAAAWTKFSGYVLFGIFAYWLSRFKHNRWSFLILLVGLLSITTYCLYGQLVGGTEFWLTLIHQGNRGAYVASMFTFFTSPQIQGAIKDGWWYIGLLSLGYLSLHTHEVYRFLSIAAFGWLLSTFVLSGPQNTSPWYIYPIYPLMMIGTALMVTEGLRKEPLVIEVILLTLGLTGWQYLDSLAMSTIIRLGTVCLIGINAFTWYATKINRQWVHRGIIGTLLVLALIGNLLAIRKAPHAACGDTGCVKPDKIILPL